MTELQERLEHLVNYSSQLIFVSGDTIAQQQKSLEDFLSVQKENTEISYIEAQTSLEITDYRRLICRQLMGQTVGSYVRPLKELLKELNSHSGPFLVCIKQSEQIPNSFLQELWEWVIYSRKQASHQHLNIILFGESKWAEQAKKWLPNKNSDKPVLLSNHSVASTGFDPSALENLMSDSSKTFFSRDPANRANLLSNKLFIFAILAVFFASFLGLISWQYPGYVSTLLTTGSLPEKPIVEVASLGKNELIDAEDSPENDKEPQTLPDAQVEIVEEDPFSANEILVADWQSQNKALQETTSEQADANTAYIEPQLEISNEQTAPEQGDFAVPDIINIEQLDAALGNNLIDDDVQILTNQSIYRFDEALILALPDDAVLLQLSGIQNPSVLTNYIQSNGLTDNTWIYETQRYGGAWYVVVYAQAFNSLAQARQSVQNLPSSVQQSEPFAKVAAQIKQEIQNQP